MKHLSIGKLMAMSVCVALMTGCSGGQQPSQEGMNRKPGNYPGNPDEWFAPQLVADNTYRNVAKLKAAYASSSFDYNLTAQLATDGILTDKSLDTMYRNIPVREDNVVWRPTTNGEYAGRKIFETEEIKGQTRTGENEEIILKDPNVDPQHLPANYQAKTTVKRRQVVTGDYTVQNYTGEWTHRQRAELLNRKSKLLEAVITALKDINDSESIDTGLDVEKFVGYLTSGQTSQETKKKD